MSAAPQRLQPDWWRKTFAGAVLGLTLAFALGGLFAWLGPGGIAAPDKAQFVMWMIAPLWGLCFALVYLFRSGARALLWLGLANAAAWGLLLAVRA
ncbi:MAG: hypothetical protein QM661_12860 [Solimonas sp.]